MEELRGRHLISCQTEFHCNNNVYLKSERFYLVTLQTAPRLRGSCSVLQEPCLMPAFFSLHLCPAQPCSCFQNCPPSKLQIQYGLGPRQCLACNKSLCFECMIAFSYLFTKATTPGGGRDIKITQCELIIKHQELVYTHLPELDTFILIHTVVRSKTLRANRVPEPLFGAEGRKS